MLENQSYHPGAILSPDCDFVNILEYILKSFLPCDWQQLWVQAHAEQHEDNNSHPTIAANLLLHETADGQLDNKRAIQQSRA